MKKGQNGVTENTPKNIAFGAGTIHKNLKYTDGAWNFDTSLLGATKGGSNFNVEPVLQDIEVDGALVAVKGLKRKLGEKAKLDINLVELTKEIIKASVLGAEGTSTDTNFDLIESKGDIAEGDYFDNIAFVGELGDGRNAIFILDNALCTSGFVMEGKNKEESVGKYTFECHAELDGDLSKLPYHLYIQKASN